MLFTNHGENNLADYFRGQGITLPANWYLSFLSAYDDASVTEVGVGLTRVAYARSLTNWSATNGAGQVVASTGSSHSTSNNVEIQMGEATGSATAVAIGLFDAAASGECWAIYPLTTPLELADNDTPDIAAGSMQWTWVGLSDYASNKLIDLFFRGQAYAWPATLYMAGYTSAPTNAGGGTEVGGGVGYARAPIDSSTDAWSATDGPGTVTPSTGTSGRISNNAAITHPQPTGNQGTWVAGALLDAPTGGNLMLWKALAEPRSVTASSEPPVWSPDAIGHTIA